MSGSILGTVESSLGSGATTSNTTPSRAYTTGSTLVIFHMVDNASTQSIAFTDSANNVAGKIGGVTPTFRDAEVAIGTDRYRIYTAENITGFTGTITSSYASSAYSSIIVVEVGGVLAASFDGAHVVSQASPGTGTDALIVSATAAQSGIMICFSVDDSAANRVAVAGTGFSDQGTFWVFGGSNKTSRLESKAYSGAGSKSATWTVNTGGGSDTYANFVVLIADTASGGSTTSKTMTDTMTLSDANVSGAKRPRTGEDTLTITDDPNRTLIVIADDMSLATIDEEVDWLRLVRVPSDTLQLADGFVSWRRIARVGQDTLTLLDGFSKTITGSGILYAKVMTEALELSDGFVSWRRLKTLITDNFDLIDGFSKTIAGAGITYVKIMSDVTTLIDDSGQRWVLRKGITTDAIGLSDAVVRALARIRILGENIEMSDGTLRILRAVRMPTESLDLSDELIRAYFPDQIFTVALRFGAFDPFRFSHSDVLRFGGH